MYTKCSSSIAFGNGPDEIHLVLRAIVLFHFKIGIAEIEIISEKTLLLFNTETIFETRILLRQLHKKLKMYSFGRTAARDAL